MEDFFSGGGAEGAVDAPDLVVLQLLVSIAIPRIINRFFI
jgi:hypothetical protein